MINIKTFLIGIVVVNILAIPLHYISFITMYASSSSAGKILPFLTYIGFMFGPQLIAIVGLYLLAKFWDLIFTRKGSWSATFTLKTGVAGALIFSVLASLYLNIVLDNLFQIRQGNYNLVFLGFVAPLGYLMVTYILGRLFEAIFQKKNN